MVSTTEEDKELTVTNEDGSVSVIKGRVTTIDHGETDKDGYPKISVHINVPVATGRTPEEVEADRLRELFREDV